SYVFRFPAASIEAFLMTSPARGRTGIFWQVEWRSVLSPHQCPTGLMRGLKCPFAPKGGGLRYYSMCCRRPGCNKRFRLSDPSFVQPFQAAVRSFSAFVQKDRSYPFGKILL